jgi:phosphoribosylglycinamide formyltransferase 1
MNGNSLEGSEASFSIAVLVSAGGSNLQQLIDCQRGYTITQVIASNTHAYAIERARIAEIPVKIISIRKDNRETSFKKYFTTLTELNPDLIVLAGFLRILPSYFIDTFYGKIINIHPALLPKHKGLETHKQVLDAGDTEHGCSVHFIDSGLDTGPTIAQAKFSVERNDTIDILKVRVGEKEKLLLPFVVRMIATKNIIVENDHLKFSNSCCEEAKNLGITLFNSKI